MRITILQGAFLPVPPLLGGAVEKVWFALGREFARRGHQVTHVSRSHPDLPEQEIIDGVEHRRVPGFDTPLSLAKLKFLDLLYTLRALRKLPPADILVTNTFWAPILLRHDRAGKIYVHVARYPRGQFQFYHAARLQAVSSPIAQVLREKFPAQTPRICSIPNPLHTPIAAALPIHCVEDDPVILYAGRIHPEKGLHLLIEAFLLLRNTPARLRLVGPWEEKSGGGGESYRQRLLQLAAPAGERIEFTGPIYDAGRLDAAYRSASLFVYPSLAELGETFGLAPLEAMAQGCPPIVSDLACFTDFIEPGKNGLVFDHRGAAPASALAENIDQLLDDPALRRSLAEASLQTAGRFSLEKVADLYLQDFASLLAA